jgi:hypothetical protein
VREDRTTPPGVLESADWDFGTERLSNRELSACHAHEYGREIARRCRYVLTQVKILWLANELPAKYLRAPGPLAGLTLSNPRIMKPLHPDRLRGYEAAFKLSMFGIPVDTLGQRGFESTLGQRGFESKSWYDLPRTVREAGVRSIRERSHWRDSGLATSVLLRTIRELEPLGTKTSDGFLCSNEELLRELVRHEKLFLYEIFHSRFYGKKIERGFFVIDWSADLGVLKKQVFEWLEKQHSERKKVPPIAKHKPSRGQLRDQLRWLGALRVKEHYGPRRLTHGNEPKLIVAAPYKWKNDLYDAAKKAKKILDDRISEGMQALVIAS